VDGRDHFPKRDRRSVTNDKSAATLGPCFFTGSKHQKADGRSSSGTSCYAGRSFWPTGSAATRPMVFLELDDRLGLRQALLELSLLSLELDLPRAGLGFGCRTAALGLEARDAVRAKLLAPGREDRRVQPFTPKQRADLARSSAAISLAHDALLVLCAEAPAHRSFEHLGIGLDSPGGKPFAALRAPLSGTGPFDLSLLGH